MHSLALWAHMSNPSVQRSSPRPYFRTIRLNKARAFGSYGSVANRCGILVTDKVDAPQVQEDIRHASRMSRQQGSIS